MKKSIYMIIVLCFVSSVSFVSCEKNEKSTKQSITITEEPIKPTNNVKNIDYEEAKKIAEEYYKEFSDNNFKAANKYRTKDNQLIAWNNIETLKIKEITPDVNNKIKNSYLTNKGTITNPTDVICLKITLEVVFDKENLNPDIADLAVDGENEVWHTFVKMTNSSSWQLDEIGPAFE